MAQRPGARCVTAAVCVGNCQKKDGTRNVVNEGVPKNAIQHFVKIQLLEELKGGPGVRFFLGISIAHDLTRNPASPGIA